LSHSEKTLKERGQQDYLNVVGVLNGEGEVKEGIKEGSIMGLGDLV